MTKYLISFPSGVMKMTPDELPQVAADSRAVIKAAKAAGVYVFGGGIDEAVAPIMVAENGEVTRETYPQTNITGGYTILELPNQSAAIEWAQKIATACRCPQEVREFMFDPNS